MRSGSCLNYTFWGPVYSYYGLCFALLSNLIFIDDMDSP